VEAERRKRTWISYARYSRIVVQRGEANESSPSAIDEKGELLEMANIDTTQLSVATNGHWFEFSLKWRCSFVPEEANFVFDTNWTLMEKDAGEFFGDDDDAVAGTVSPGVHSAHSDVKRFKPVDINPANPRLVEFTETRSWHQDDVDTEIGNEEIYANAHLRNITLNEPIEKMTVRRSNLLELAP
jgi:hypothetical protein